MTENKNTSLRVVVSPPNSGLIRCMFWPMLSDLHQNEFCRFNCVVVLFFNYVTKEKSNFKSE